MPDYVEVTPGSGVFVACDEIDGIQHQRMKVEFGEDGSAVDASARNPLPTTDAAVLAAVDGLEAVLATIDADTGNIATAAAAIRTAVETLDNAIAGSEMQVDVVGPLPAGTNAIGKLAANSGVDIGDVDVTSLPALPTGANSIGKVKALEDALPAGTNNIGQVDPRGNVAHDGADSGNPVKVGARARTALPAAVAQDDRTDAVADKFGRQLVTVAPLDQRRTGSLNKTDNSAGDVIAAPGASIAIVVTDILVVNAHGTVGTKVSIRDDTTAKLTGYAGALGGGFTLSDPNGLFVATANKAVTAICGTTGADVDVFVSGYLIPA